MEYFIGKTHCFSTNSKTAKHSVCKAILEKDYPEKLEGLELSEGLPPYYGLVPSTDAPEKPILMLFREPIDRFISAASMNHGLNDIEESLAKLGEYPFDKQVDYIIEGQTTVFKFPEQLEQFCEAAGFPYPLEKINEATAGKKELTPEQLATVEQFFADDIAFFNGL